MGLNANDLWQGKVYNIKKYNDDTKDYTTTYTVRFNKRKGNILVFNNTFNNKSLNRKSDEITSDEITVEVDNGGFTDGRTIITSTGIMPGLSKTNKTNTGGSKKSRKQRKSKKQRKQRKSKTTKKNKNIIF